jgi:hypothetical protein
VQVQAAQAVVPITWASREQLLDRLQPKTARHPARAERRKRKPPAPPEAHREIVAAFTAVGVSRPVSLTSAQRGELRLLLDGWDEMPDGLRGLHAALAEE